MHFLRHGNGPVVFLLHGFVDSSISWQPLISRLAKDFCVIAPDFPGFGKNTAMTPCKTLKEFAGTVIGLADALGIEMFSVVGHSMGGFVAQQLLADWEDRITSAVLYGTGLRIDPEKRFESAEQTIARLKSEGVESTAARVAATWFTDGVDNPCYELCLEAARGMTLEAGIATVDVCGSADFSKAMQRVDTPVLIIQGDQERSFPPEMGLQLKHALPHAALCILPGCGHAAHLERQDLFNQVVADFLRQAPAAAARSVSPSSKGLAV